MLLGRRHVQLLRFRGQWQHLGLPLLRRGLRLGQSPNRHGHPLRHHDRRPVQFRHPLLGQHLGLSPKRPAPPRGPHLLGLSPKRHAPPRGQLRGQPLQCMSRREGTFGRRPKCSRAREKDRRLGYFSPQISGSR